MARTLEELNKPYSNPNREFSIRTKERAMMVLRPAAIAPVACTQRCGEMVLGSMRWISICFQRVRKYGFLCGCFIESVIDSSY